MTPRELEERLVEFALRVISVSESLPNTMSGRHIAKQLLRSGTSPAANYSEAVDAESDLDFVHKMKVSLKELRETLVWLRIAHRKPLVDNPARLEPILKEADELVAIFVSSISTVRKRMAKSESKPRLTNDD